MNKSKSIFTYPLYFIFIFAIKLFFNLFNQPFTSSLFFTSFISTIRFFLLFLIILFFDKLISRKKRKDHKAYTTITDYLKDKKIILSFSAADINLMKDKIIEIYDLNSIENPKEVSRKLSRLKSELMYVEQNEHEALEFANNIVLYGVIIGVLAGSSELIINNFITRFKTSLTVGILATFFIVLMVMVGIPAIVAVSDIIPEKKKSKNRQITILALDEMINERELK